MATVIKGGAPPQPQNVDLWCERDLLAVASSFAGNTAEARLAYVLNKKIQKKRLIFPFPANDATKVGGGRRARTKVHQLWVCLCVSLCPSFAT